MSSSTLLCAPHASISLSVMSMKGRAVSPITRSLRPAFQIGAGISIAETNCDDARASTEVSPPSNRAARRIDDHRRAVVVALAVHARAEPLHRVELRPDRTLAHPLIAVDAKASLAERDHRDDEAHHGAGAADKDLAAMRRDRAAAPADRDPARGLVDLDAETHHPERVAHVARVVAQQHRVEHRAPLRQRRQHHRAIRDALGARDHHARVERSGQRSDFDLLSVHRRYLCQTNRAD